MYVFFGGILSTLIYRLLLDGMNITHNRDGLLRLFAFDWVLLLFMAINCPQNGLMRFVMLMAKLYIISFLAHFDINGWSDSIRGYALTA